MSRALLILAACFGLARGWALADDPPARKTENVIVVTLDGFRWQEFFRGADETLIDKQDGGVRDVDGLKKDFLRETAEARREALLPFIWGTVAKRGQIYGDPTRGAAASITNGLKFSYPGYNEMFCGFADPSIDANARKANPNLSVLEFLNEKPAYKGRVSAYCTWDLFPFIFRSNRNGLKVVSGWSSIADKTPSEHQRRVDELTAYLPRIWPDNVFDAITMEGAREEIRRHAPRVLYVGLGETDEWGHGRRYDLYLHAAHNADRFLAELWEHLQGLPQYAGKTALVITTDHGRGLTRVDWTDHGKDVPGAEFIWMAVMGPDTPALGLRQNVNVTQAQFAATIAALLGEDFSQAQPRAAPPLPDLSAAKAAR